MRTTSPPLRFQGFDAEQALTLKYVKYSKDAFLEEFKHYTHKTKTFSRVELNAYFNAVLLRLDTTQDKNLLNVMESYLDEIQSEKINEKLFSALAKATARVHEQSVL